MERNKAVDECFENHPTHGTIRPICNHRIDGYKCRCYARYVVVDNVQYWKLFYLVNQRPVYDKEYNYLIRQMYNIAITMISVLKSKGMKIVVYTSWNHNINLTERSNYDNGRL